MREQADSEYTNPGEKDVAARTSNGTGQALNIGTSRRTFTGALAALSASASIGQTTRAETAAAPLPAEEPISPQAAEYRDFLRNLAAKLRADPKMPISRTREIYEHWGDLGAEPANVDYEVPALTA